MEKEDNTVLTPKRPFKFFVDLDPIAYAGASCGEQTYYKWERFEEGKEEPVEFSDPFTKASEAADWISSEVWDDDIESLGWKRKTWVVVKPLKEALKATKNVMDAYIRVCEFNCRKGKKAIVRGFLTASGKKNKDVGGLENQYQFNRIGKGRPLYLKECRQWVLDNFPGAMMAKKGIEADAYCIAMAELAGEDGCLASIDKDLSQLERSWFINTKSLFPTPNAMFSSGIGELHEVINYKGEVSGHKGCGFKFLCFQAVVGDVTDGYKGLYLVGGKKAYKALKDCDTKEGCILAIKKLYDTKFKNGYACKRLKEMGCEPVKGHYLFYSWDNKFCNPTVTEIMNQHFFVAYQERSSNDIFRVEDYLKVEET